jgi:hypothetical protein
LGKKLYFSVSPATLGEEYDYGGIKWDQELSVPGIRPGCLSLGDKKKAG